MSGETVDSLILPNLHVGPREIKEGAGFIKVLKGATSGPAFLSAIGKEGASHVFASGKKGAFKMAAFIDGLTARVVFSMPTKLLFPTEAVTFDDKDIDSDIEALLPLPKRAKVDAHISGAYATYFRHALVQDFLLTHTRSTIEKVMFYGYGSGGAVAVLAGLHAGMHSGVLPISVVLTYGSPRVGNVEFVNLVERQANVTVHRVVRNGDAVASWPAEQFGFKHLGYEIEMKNNGSMTYCLEGRSTLDRGLGLWTLIFTAGFALMTSLVSAVWGTFWHTRQATKARVPGHHWAGIAWLIVFVAGACTLSSLILYNALRGLSIDYYDNAINPESPDPGTEAGVWCSRNWEGSYFAYSIIALLMIFTFVLAFSSIHTIGAAKPMLWTSLTYGVLILLSASTGLT